MGFAVLSMTYGRDGRDAAGRFGIFPKIDWGKTQKRADIANPDRGLCTRSTV
jgi:hypothetical protein